MSFLPSYIKSSLETIPNLCLLGDFFSHSAVLDITALSTHQILTPSLFHRTEGRTGARRIISLSLGSCVLLPSCSCCCLSAALSPQHRHFSLCCHRWLCWKPIMISFPCFHNHLFTPCFTYLPLFAKRPLILCYFHPSFTLL